MKDSLYASSQKGLTGYDRAVGPLLEDNGTCQGPRDVDTECIGSGEGNQSGVAGDSLAGGPSSFIIPRAEPLWPPIRRMSPCWGHVHPQRRYLWSALIPHIGAKARTVNRQRRSAVEGVVCEHEGAPDRRGFH